MREALRDPKAAPAWRTAAFEHLAGTGGAVGATAVRAARPHRSPRQPWFERINVSRLPADYRVATKKDAQGRTWMLFHSPVLGNASDLFVVQKLGAKWARPLFTGAWTGPTFRSEAPKAVHGIPIARLVAKEWIRLFPADNSIRRDSDHDGLTDLVESRLSTNPRQADTDGDKLLDSVDPCPNAAPRALGDSEKIVAACIEARFFSQDWGVPALLSVENIKPFEIYGYAPVVIWRKARRDKGQAPLDTLYGGGVNLISFHSPGEDSRGKPFVRYSADRQTARTVISRYSGGLNGDGIEVSLKKVGGDWFVVDTQMRYVS
jgi:hypothetical protein